MSGAVERLIEHDIQPSTVSASSPLPFVIHVMNDTYMYIPTYVIRLIVTHIGLAAKKILNKPKREQKHLSHPGHPFINPRTHMRSEGLS